MVENIIREYEKRGIKFWVENNQLKFKAPAGALNDEDKIKLREVKAQLIEYYSNKELPV